MQKAFVVLFLLCGFTGNALATNYVEPDDFKKWLITGKEMILIDIQPHDAFVKQHFKGAVETNAFPGKTTEEKARLDKTLPIIEKSTLDVVVVCPRGGSGAKNAYDYLKSKGIVEERLFILEDGIDNWPYKELFDRK